MIEFSIRKFYKTPDEDRINVVPKASLHRLPTADEVSALENSFDVLAKEMGAVEMTEEELTQYLADEQADAEATGTVYAE